MTTQDIVVSNVEALMAKHGDENAYQVAARTGIPVSTVKTLLTRARSPNVRLLDSLSSGYKIEIWRLTAPNLGADVQKSVIDYGRIRNILNAIRDALGPDVSVDDQAGYVAFFYGQGPTQTEADYRSYLSTNKAFQAWQSTK